MATYDNDDFNSPPDDEDENLSEDSFNDYSGENDHHTEGGFTPENKQGNNEQLAFDYHEEKSEYLVLDESDIQRSMDTLIADVASVIDEEKEKAGLLLRAYNWSKEKLIAAYFEDASGVIKKVGLQFLDEADDPSLPNSNKGSMNEEIECRICDDDFPLNQTHSIGCGHRFCVDCWRIYLTEAVANGPAVLSTRCPSYQCPALTPNRTFSLLPPSLFTRFLNFLLRSYIERNSNMRWCPNAGCSRAIQRLIPSVTAVTCTCGFSFCFKCGEESHEPATCEQIRIWNEKCKNESETAHWIIVNTKKCPKCTVRVEKNQGCNHMTCRACKYEWCWVCNGVWSEHGTESGGYYKCNKYDPKSNTAKLEKLSSTVVDSAKQELNRYLFYFQRFHNHQQSRKFVEKTKSNIESKIATLAEKNSQEAYIDNTFLSTAHTQILLNRHVLQYTYVFAYFLPIDSTAKNLFEYLQQQLEKSTEQLNEMCEMQIDRFMKKKEERVRVVNFARVTQNFRENLLRGVKNGLTGGDNSSEMEEF